MEKEIQKIDIRNLSAGQIVDFILSIGEKEFRARQINSWLWEKSVSSFDEMSNLSVDLRKKLEEHFVIRAVKIAEIQTSDDNTLKIAFELFDGLITEGVLIPADSRITACISSQVGCALGCHFCATGQMKLKRDLRHDEIYDQVALLRRLALEKFGQPLSNIVMMGMGEPLLNYENVKKAIYYITTEDGLGISPKRITLSTSGITSGIKQLANDNVKYNLAVSLHVANQLKRNSIMPVSKANPLRELTDALKYFYQKTGSRITFEYLLLKDFNDTLNDAKELAAFCRNIPCKVNLIEYNPVEGSGFERSPETNVRMFTAYLESRNLVVNIRQSRGKDINAACGQLAARLQCKMMIE